MGRVKDLAPKNGDLDLSSLEQAIAKLQNASAALDEEKKTAEKELKKLLRERRRRRRGLMGKLRGVLCRLGFFVREQTGIARHQHGHDKR